MSDLDAVASDEKVLNEMASNEKTSNEMASNEMASNETASNETASNETASNEMEKKGRRVQLENNATCSTSEAQPAQQDEEEEKRPRTMSRYEFVYIDLASDASTQHHLFITMILGKVIRQCPKNGR